VKVEYRLFVVVALFFWTMALIYGFASSWSEQVGPVALGLCGLLGAMVAYYLWFTGRRLPERPEDNPTALISDQEGDFGFFSPYSWWPLFVGISGAITFLGLAVGWWMFIIGATFGALATVGWTFEYFRGEHAL
jgi:hypothetical protein